MDLDDARLGTVDLPLVHEVSGYDTTRLRAAAAAVVRHGLSRAGVSDPRVDAALARLAAGQWGDGPARDELRALVDELDEAAWDAQDAGRPDYLPSFARARAAGALDYALDADPLLAALEAAYEVQAGLGDLPGVTAILRAH